jgi:DNA/RNA endonuclease G (NUC1)
MAKACAVISRQLRTLLVASVAFLALRLFAANAPEYAHSTLGESDHWTALKWSPEDVALFGGLPGYSGKQKHIILVRYSYFVSAYDTDRLAPMWVAHVDENDSDAKSRARTKGTWDRGTDKFRPDDNVVTYSKARDVRWVTDDSFVNANPPTLPPGEKGYAKITRGHMASNQEMKSLGDDNEGEVSQSESFSLANVAPQMQHHNAPLWSSLEEDCIKWAAIKGRVAIFSGPVYAPDWTQPPPANRIYYATGKDGVKMPIPTHFFKIIIGRTGGKISAVAFLIPHRSDLSKDDLKNYIVPVRKIEQVTKLNFMPALGTNDEVEKVKDSSWLTLVP